MAKMIITNAGIAEVVNAENNGTAPVKLSHVAFGTGQYSATAEQTALKAEFKRFGTISGGNAGDNKISVSMLDDSTAAYSVYEIGVFTEAGTLFAVYSQTTAILSKAAASVAMLAVDILLDEMNPANITVGDTNFRLNPATTEIQGVIELATEAEAKGKTDNQRAITAATLQAVIQNHSNIVHRSGVETITGQKTFTEYIIKDGTLARNHSPNSYISVSGNKTSDTGGGVWLYGEEHMTYPGCFLLRAAIKGEYKELLGTQEGQLIWDGKNIVRSINSQNADAAGNVILLTFPNTVTIQKGDIVLVEGGVKKSNKTDALDMCSGTTYADSPALSLYPTDYALDSEMAGRFVLRAGANAVQLVGTAEGALNWNGKPVVVVDAWKSSDGKSWYRKYADGWIEQGGNIACDGTDEVTITFNAPFSNTNFQVMFTARNAGSTGTRYFHRTRSRSKSMVILADHEFSLNASSVDWYACGY